MIISKLYDRRPFAMHKVGEIVTARIATPLERSGSVLTKPRPAILLNRVGAFWTVMGLTTLPTFADGTPRVSVTNPERYGITGGRRSYFWGRPTKICALDVGDHIGFADNTLMDTVRRIVTMH